jgi:hypothetical protein
MQDESAWEMLDESVQRDSIGTARALSPAPPYPVILTL